MYCTNSGQNVDPSGFEKFWNCAEFTISSGGGNTGGGIVAMELKVIGIEEMKCCS